MSAHVVPPAAASAASPTTAATPCCWLLSAQTKRYQYYPKPVTVACQAPYKLAACPNANRVAASPPVPAQPDANASGVANSTACRLHDSVGAAACCGSRVLLHPACRTDHGRAAAARVLGLDFALSPMGSLRAFQHVDGKKCKRSKFAGNSARARLRHDLSDWLGRSSSGGRRGYGLNDPLSQRKWYPSWRGCFGCDEGGCCKDRGSCELGVCVCQTGWCGLDCGQPCDPSREDAGDVRARVGLAVYVYDLPIDMGLIQFSHRVWARNLRNGEMIYAAEWRFLELLLGDSATRALRPEDADLFYIPMLGALGPGGSIGGGCERDKLELIIRYVRARWPWWDRSGGRDHVLFMTGDQGACGLGSALARPIIISHWGMMGTMKRLTAFDKEQPDWVDSEEAKRNMVTGKWCHGPHKDVVVPPFSGMRAARAEKQSRPTTVSTPDGNASCTWRSKSGECKWRGTPQLLHAGGVWGWHNTGVKGKVSFYSQGMRQALFLKFHGDAGGRHRILVSDRSVPDELWTQATFCFAPSGSGCASSPPSKPRLGYAQAGHLAPNPCGSWGMRTVKILSTLDCLPMISQPYVVQPLETVLPMEGMSARVNYTQVEQLPEMLEQLTSPVKLEAMRARARRVRLAFAWGPGGLAYNFTILALCHRAVELRGALKAGSGASCATLAEALPLAFRTSSLPSWISEPVAKAVRELQAARRHLVATAAKDEPSVAARHAQIGYGP